MGALADIRVLVAGAGPAGVAAARTLRDAGASVDLVDRLGADHAPRIGNVVIGSAGTKILRTIGAGALVDDPRTSLETRTAGEHLFDIGQLDSALHDAARGAGLTIQYDTQVLALHDASDGAVATLRTADGTTIERSYDYAIDATGGRVASMSGPLVKQPTGNAKTYVIAQTRTSAVENGGRLAPDGGAFSIANARTGVTSLYVTPDGADALAVANGNTDAMRSMIDDARAKLDLGPVVAGTAHVVNVHEAIAPHAAYGHLLLAGDSAANHMPSQQMGVTLALVDGTTAANAIVSDVRGTVGAFDRYDSTTIAMHRAFLSDK